MWRNPFPGLQNPSAARISGRLPSWAFANVFRHSTRIPKGQLRIRLCAISGETPKPPGVPSTQIAVKLSSMVKFFTHRRARDPRGVDDRDCIARAARGSRASQNDRSARIQDQSLQLEVTVNGHALRVAIGVGRTLMVTLLFGRDFVMLMAPWIVLKGSELVPGFELLP